jgi:transmembrane sensor
MKDDQKEKLLLILKSDSWSNEDLEWLMHELNQPNGSWVLTILRQEFDNPSTTNSLHGNADSEAILGILHDRMGITQQRKRTGRLRYFVRTIAVAASLAIGIFFVNQIWQNTTDQAESNMVSRKRTITSDFDPGTDKAILVLPDGSTIALDTVKDGHIRSNSESLSILLQQGSIGYVMNGEEGEFNVDEMMHTVMTPRGGQFRLTLSDGTRVWLNSASSIRYPAIFSGNDRRVAITGEAYFEVAHDGDRPFFVDTDSRGVVKVLGTRFNVNTYKDEGFLGVTLLEGSVRFGIPGNELPATLVPGQQARLDPGGKIIISQNIETKSIIAWKEGKFDFGDGMELTSAMRQIARWYDVDVRYEGEVVGQVGGSISRDVKLSKVLEMIGLTGIANFSVSGGGVRVSKPGR